jgi:hypothetical protein
VWPKEKIKQRIDQIEVERADVPRQLDGSGSQLDSGGQLVLGMLDLLSDPPLDVTSLSVGRSPRTTTTPTPPLAAAARAASPNRIAAVLSGGTWW